MPFTFDTEAVCGIKLSTKVSPYPTQTVIVTATVGKSETVATGTAAVTTGIATEATTGTATGTNTEGASSVVTKGSASSTSTADSAAGRDAPRGKTVVGAAVVGVVLGTLLW